jgi:peptidoglycan/LPS O-acetylase OafA/YrhL
MISGLVLAKSNTLRSSTTFGYIAPRMVRLYLPIWGSLFLAIALASLRPSVDAESFSWWYQSQLSVDRAYFSPPLNKPLFNNFTVLLGTDWLNSSLWSMRVEIMFSILLLVVILLARMSFIGVGISLSIAIFAMSTETLRDFSYYLPFFVVGATLGAVEWSPNKAQSRLLMLLGILVTLCPWLFNLFGDWGQMEFLGQSPSLVRLVLQLVGITLIVVSALGGNIKVLGSNAVTRYLSNRSYSLYLTHAPVLTFAAIWIVYSGRNSVGWLMWLPVTLVSVFLVAETFFRLIEEPSRNLSRKLKSNIKSKRIH